MALLCSGPPPSIAQEADTDWATCTTFPALVRFTDAGTERKLELTGLTGRRKFFLNVYCVAHYMQDVPHGTPQAVLGSVLEDDSAKQVTMDFVRDVSSSRIQGALLEGFRENSTDSEFEQIQPFLKKFLDSIDKDVKEDDRFVIRWLPGGRTISLFRGQEVSRITNVTFARALWSIWFGEESVVDRSELVKFLKPPS